MADNNTEKYDLYLTGEVAGDGDPAQALERLAILFKRPAEQVAPLLKGKRHCIKRGMSSDDLQRYQQILGRIGVLNQSELATSQNPSDNAPAGEQAKTQTLQLSPSGTPVLTEAERRRLPTADVDTSSISLAAVGTKLSDHPLSPPAPPPVIDHLSLAGPGATLGDEGLPLPEINLDDLTAGLSLMPSGSRMSEPDDDAPPPPPDTSHLKLQS